MARLTLRLAALPLTFALAGPLAAQSQGDALDGFELNLKASQDVIAGETFKADAAYLEKAGKPGWAPFTVVVPIAENRAYESRVVEAPATGLVKFSFTTPGGGFIDAVSFSAARLPMAEEEPRLEYLAELMNAELVPGIIEGKDELERAKIRKVEVGGSRGVEIFGSYAHDSFGMIHWRLVGIPNPGAEEGLVALAQMAKEAVPITSPDDFPATLSGRVLNSLSFE